MRVTLAFRAKNVCGNTHNIINRHEGDGDGGGGDDDDGDGGDDDDGYGDDGDDNPAVDLQICDDKKRIFSAF